MKMITDSLEKVYTAMGGTDPFNKDDIAEGLDQISDVAGSGSGGGSAESVEFTLDGDTWSCNKTYAELNAMNESNALPIFVRVYGNPNLATWSFGDEGRPVSVQLILLTFQSGEDTGQVIVSWEDFRITSSDEITATSNYAYWNITMD